MSYFLLLPLVIPACRHKGYGDDSFKLVSGVLALLQSDKLMLVYFDNLGSSNHSCWPWHYERLNSPKKTQETQRPPQSNLQINIQDYLNGLLVLS